MQKMICALAVSLLCMSAVNTTEYYALKADNEQMSEQAEIHEDYLRLKTQNEELAAAVAAWEANQL